MIKQPIPKLKEKKACPSALKTTEEVNLLKSGLKRKSNPASAFGKVTERTHMISKIKNKSGIMILEARTVQKAKCVATHFVLSGNMSMTIN